MAGRIAAQIRDLSRAMGRGAKAAVPTPLAVSAPVVGPVSVGIGRGISSDFEPIQMVVGAGVGSVMGLSILTVLGIAGAVVGPLMERKDARQAEAQDNTAALQGQSSGDFADSEIPAKEL